MKKHIRTWLITIIISILCIGLPWVISHFGLIAERDVLTKYSFLSVTISILFSYLYIRFKVQDRVSRLYLLLMNPSILYLAILVVIAILFANTKWNGFTGLIP